MVPNTKGLELEGKFLSAGELNLSEKHRCALIKTLAFIEAGRTAHVSDFYSTQGGPDGFLFNMRIWHNRTACGTVCCLGGTAELVGDVNFNFVKDACSKRSQDHLQLQDLFGLYKDRFHGMNGVTERQAGVALRNYLETGRPNWDAALKTPR